MKALTFHFPQLPLHTPDTPSWRESPCLYDLYGPLSSHFQRGCAVGPDRVLVVLQEKIFLLLAPFFLQFTPAVRLSLSLTS